MLKIKAKPYALNKPHRQNLDYFIQDSKYPNAFINLYHFLLAELPPWL